MKRAAFTLIEVMVALVVTGLVVTLAYGAAHAGFEVEDRVNEVRDGVQAESQARVFLGDALRHSLPGTRGAGDVFQLTDAMHEGLPADALTFDTRGVESPFGAGDVWRVTLQLTDEGAAITAHSLRDPGHEVHGLLPGVRGVNVMVRPRGEGAPWRETWDDPDVAPRTVSVALLNAAGRSTSAPLVTQLGLDARSAR
jgi:prepilin-type N-terminal cleavage/methylation domain-containing protein